jgi:hypothetical protein
MCGAGVYLARDKFSWLQEVIPSNKIEDGYDDQLTVNHDYKKNVEIHGRSVRYCMIPYNVTRDKDDFKEEEASKVGLWHNMEDFYYEECMKD